MSTSTRSKRRRGVTRRVRDAQGNLVVKKYKRRGKRFNIPGLKFKHIPQILVGSSFGSYGYVAYLHKSGALAASDNAFAIYFQYIFDNYDSITALFLAGSFATAVGAFMGYAIVTKGYRVKRYGAAFRQLFALIAAFVIISAITSPFINEPGKIRQLDTLISVTDNYDLSGLESPFYSELLDGLLDLLGNIPDPSMSVANITISDGFPLDPSVDRYLWRWAVSDTYDAEKNDYVEGYPNVVLDYETSALNASAAPNNTRQFRVDEQFLSITTSFTGKMLSPWNSELGAQVGSPSTFTYAPAISTVEVQEDKTSTYRDRNEQPIEEFSFSEAGGGGSFSFDTFWNAEDKESITTKSVPYLQLASYLDGTDPARFGDTTTADAISKIWGGQALTGGSESSYVANDPYNAFAAEYNSLSSQINSNTSTYGLVFQIFNKISNQLIQDFLAGNVDISSTDATSLAGDIDKAYFYYDALKNGNLYGVKDMLAGLINMLRAFDIPTRLVMGFSVGNFDNNRIELTMGHIHAWIETLIPWVDANNNVHHSWGIFNPIPDPYVLADTGELEYGRNALGGSANLTLSVNSGLLSTIPNGEQVDGQDSFSFFNFGDKVEGNVSLSFDQISAAEQPVELRLLNDTILDSGGNIDFATLDVNNLGTSLGTLITDTSGNADFSFNVSRSGVLLWENANGSVTNVTQTQGLSVQGFRPFETLGQNNIYMLLAMYGVNYDLVAVSWGENSVIDVKTPDVQSVSIPNGFDTIDAAIVIPGEAFNISITYSDNSTGEPIVGESNIELLVMDRDTFLTLQSSFVGNTLDPSIIATYGQGLFPATDLTGKANKTYNFDFADTPNDFYAIIAQLTGTSIFGVMFMYLSLDVTFQVNSFDTGADNKITTAVGEVYVVTTSAEELGGAASALLGFTPRPAAGIALSYYAMEFDLFVASYFGQSYATLATALGSCSSTAGIGTCFYFDPQGSETKFSISGGGTTGSDGIAVANLNITNTAFSVNDYVILIVNPDFQSFTNTSRFLVLSPPGLAASLNALDIDIFADINIWFMAGMIGLDIWRRND